MKKFYTLICAGFFLTLSASAQWTGGQFEAVQSGNWVTTAGVPIWLSGDGVHNGAPPSRDNLGSSNGLCNNCLISLQIPGGGTVTLNTQVSLTGGSELLIGPGVTLVIAPSSTGSFTGANDIVLTDQNPGQINRIVWQDGTAKLDASQLTAANQFDGVFTSVQNATNDFTLTKQVGVAPRGFHAVSGTATVTDNSNAVFGNGLGIVGPVTLSNSNGIVDLPIIISSFTATLVDQNVVNLAWTTTLEQNADHFAIQRSVDAGAHWATLGTEAAKGGSFVTNYTYADSKPAAGTSEYRLQLVDKDGTYKYSDVKTIRNGPDQLSKHLPQPRS